MLAYHRRSSSELSRVFQKVYPFPSVYRNMSVNSRNTRSSKRKAIDSVSEEPVTVKVPAAVSKATKIPKVTKKPKIDDEVGPIAISIEHCKSWNAFKTRANRVKVALDASTEHAFKVTINEEKPRKGSFVISMEGKDKPILEMLGLIRPFPSLKALNIDEVVEDVLTAASEEH